MVDTNGIGTFQPFLLVTLGFPVGTTMNTVRLPTANEEALTRTLHQSSLRVKVKLPSN